MRIANWLQRLTRIVASRRGSRIQSRRTDSAWQNFGVTSLAERLEERALLSTLYVDDTLFVTMDRDSSGGLSTGDQVTFANGEVGQTSNLTFNAAPVGGDVGSAYSTIQSAIDAAAAAGDTIDVAAGTYNEALTITKSVILQGDPNGSRPLIELPSGTAGTVTITASNVTVQGLQINKSDQASETGLISIPRGGSFPDFTIAYSDIRLNNLVFTNGRRAAFITGQNVTIENSTFSGQLRDALYFDAVSGTTTITANQFSGATGSRKAILIEGFTGVPISSGTVNISGNTLNGKDNFFVYNSWGDPVNQKISLNLTNNKIINSSSHGITIYDPRQDGSFDPANFAKITTVVVSDNDLSGVASGKFAVIGVSDADFPVAVDASGNWWGTTDATAVATRVKGPVDFTPMLASGTDTNLIAPGFQGDFSTVIVHSLGEQVGPVGRIQEGVGLVTSSGTVNVAAGTYNEGSFGINQGVTLSGPNAVISPNTGMRVAEAIINGSGGGQPIRVSTTDLVTFQGLTITNTQLDGYTPNSQIAFLKNTISNLPGNMFYNQPDTFTLTDNHIFGTASGSDDLLIAGDYDGTTGTQVNISGNTFSGSTGVSANLSSVQGTVANNTFDGVDIGVLLANASGNIGITNNTFENINRGSAENANASFGAGVLFFQPSYSNTVTISGNTFQDSDTGIRVSSFDGGNVAGLPITIESNTFTNNIFDVFHFGTGTLPLAGTNIVDGVTLSAATVSQLNTIADGIMDGVDFPGKGLVLLKPGHVYVTANSFFNYTGPTGPTTPSIQRGIDLATAGDTVHVAAGTYPENVIVNKNLTLDGEGSAATDVKILPAAGTALTITGAAATVTVRDLQLTGTGTGLSATGQTTLTLNDVANDATTGGSVSAVTAFNYTTGPGADVISASATSLSNTGALPFSAVTLSAIGSLTVDGAAGDDTITVTPPASGGTAITTNGGANTDTLIYNAAGGSPTVTPTAITQAGKQDVNYAAMENIVLLNVVGPFEGQGTSGADTFEVRNNMGTVEFRTNGGPWVAVTTGPLNIMGGEGDDSLVLDFAGGNPIPSGGLTFDGGEGGNDKLGIHGDNTQVVVYTPDATTNGSGVIEVNGSNITFSNLEPVDFDNVGAFSFVLPGANDVVDIANGFNSAVTAGAEPIGTVPALVISGTSGGVGFESAHVFRTTSITIVTTAVAGDDTITITSANNAHLNTDLTMTAGLEVADTITVNGVVTFTGTATLNAQTISLNANITNAATGSTATVVNVTSPGQIQDGVNVAASVAAVNVAAGTYTEVADLSTKAITLVPGVTPAQVNVNGVTLTSDDTLNIQIGGTTPGNTATNYDQLNVAGTVNLGNATLNLSAFNGFISANGDTFVIIANDDTPLDAVTGTFNGLPEGATLTNFLGITGLNAIITYAGGTGNDVVITVEPPTVTLEVSPASLIEAGSNTTVTATLSAISAQDVIVDLTFSGTATNFSDYVRTGTQIVILAGSTSSTVTLTAVQDLLDETDETIIVDISGVTGADELNTQQVTATILDDDVAPSVSLLVSPSSIAEAGGVASVTAVLSALSGQDVTVTLAFSGTAADGTDYTHFGSTIVIAAGTLSNSLNLTAVSDILDETDETIVVDIDTVTNGTELGIQQGITTILDDDPATATLSISDVTVMEGNSGSVLASFTVTLSEASGQAVTVNAATADNTAVAPGDYLAVPSTLITFLPGGPLTQTFTVTVNGDTLDEINETYFVNLSNALNATITDAQGLGTILDDDPTTATLSINDVTVAEGNGGPVFATFTVTLSAVSGQTVTVNAATADNTAVAPGDYLAVPATLVTFAPGQTTQTVTVQVNGDALDEILETYFVNLSTPLNATIADAQGLGTITDDDLLPTLSINDVTVTEGDSDTTNAVFTVTLSAASGQPVTVVATSADGTATNPSDYFEIPPTTLTFAPGETSKTVTVLVSGDTITEADETFFVTLSGATNATVTNPQGVGTIINDDVFAPTLVSGFVGLVNDPEKAGQQMLLVVGTIANDRIEFFQRLYGNEIIVRLNRVDVVVFDHDDVSRIVAYGLTGNDRIVVSSLLGKSAELHGDEGNDTLYGGTGNDTLYGGEGNDYANGRRGLDIIYGEEGNDRLYGEAGHDILLGGAGNDRLDGGRDRDILIGGIGNDTLRGSSGDDILIGGETAHDDDEEALKSILAEWTSGNDYATRVENIRDGGGQSDGFSLSADETVIDDGEVDQLFGNSNQDWFFNFDSANDRLKDKRTSSNPKSNELVN